MFRLAISSVLLQFAVAGATTTPSKGSVGETKSDVQFRVLVPQPTFSSADSMWLQYDLINKTQKALWINGRMSAGPSGVPAAIREIRLEIRNELGEVQPYSCMDKRSMATDSDYKVVRPGDTLSVRRYVYCYDLPPGKYVIFAEYHDANPDPPQPPPGTERFSGTLKAPLVSVRINRQSLSPRGGDGN